MVVVKHSGNFNKTEKLLREASHHDVMRILTKYARKGADALSSATPVDTGKTASSWSYDIVKTRNGYTIYWTNDNLSDGIPVAILIQYGHGTNGGGFVQGYDYINPALAPIFKSIADDAWKEVTGG